FTSVNGFLFFREVEMYGVASLRPMLDLLPRLLLFLAPAVTMRALAEDSRSGTLEVVLAQPITELELLAGKYLGQLSVLVIALAMTLTLPLGLALGAHLPVGVLVAQYVGATLLIAGLVAAAPATRDGPARGGDDRGEPVRTPHRRPDRPDAGPVVHARPRHEADPRRPARPRDHQAVRHERAPAPSGVPETRPGRSVARLSRRGPRPGESRRAGPVRRQRGATRGTHARHPARAVQRAGEGRAAGKGRVPGTRRALRRRRQDHPLRAADERPRVPSDVRHPLAHYHQQAGDRVRRDHRRTDAAPDATVLRGAAPAARADLHGARGRALGQRNPARHEGSDLRRHPRFAARRPGRQPQRVPGPRRQPAAHGQRHGALAARPVLVLAPGGVERVAQ